MHFKQKKQIVVLLLILSTLILSQTVSFAQGDATNNIEYSGAQKKGQILSDPVPNKQFTPPPASFYQYKASGVGNTTATDIQVTYIGNWSNEAKAAFEYSASIWESQIDSTVPIRVQVTFSSLGGDVLGSAGPETFFAAVANQPVADSFYPVALANALAGTDLNGSNPEIVSEFNKDFDWYYGTDGNTPIDKTDFVSVAVHELGHGLGFIDSMSIDGGNGSWGGGDPFPFIYDRFIEDGSGTSLVTGFPNNSAAFAAQLTSNNLYFNGPLAVSANGSRVKLFAPNPYEGGSSIGHLDPTVFPDFLMTPAIGMGTANHNPGAGTIGMFQDMGWKRASTTPTAPVISPLPSVLIQTGTSKNQAVDLWQYVQDGNDNDSQLTYEIIGQTDSQAGATISSNRYIDVNPNPANWAGSSTVTVKVTNTQSLSSQATMLVISGDISYVFLPVIIK